MISVKNVSELLARIVEGLYRNMDVAISSRSCEMHERLAGSSDQSGRQPLS